MIFARLFMCLYMFALIYSGGTQAQAINRNMYTPQMFGAVGDGITDDTAAVQKAVYAVCEWNGEHPVHSGGQILFPAGSYILSNIIIPCNGVRFLGVSNGNVNSGSNDYRGSVLISTQNNSGIMFKYTSTNQDYGTGISFEHFAIDATGMMPSSSNPDATIFDISWTQHSTIKDISIRNPYNIFREEGGAVNVIEDVNALGLRNIGIEFFGDSSQCQSLASCSKRADLLRVSRVNMNGAEGHTATCFSYHDFAQSLDIDHSVCESARFGINSYCNLSMGHNGEACPAFARFYDFEAEDCLTCINASDVQDWEIISSYLLGHGADSSHVAQFYNTNYGGVPSSTNNGSYAAAVRIHGGRFGNAGGSVISMGMTDFIIEGTQTFSSSLADTAHRIGAPNIEVTSAGSTNIPQQGIIADNLLCVANGQQPLGLMEGGIWLDPGVNFIKVHDNVLVGCSGEHNGINDFSGKPYNDIHNN
ncbi:hypothetical protein GS535_03460 [Saccharibacter sp. EH611]|uniref:glycosyl hydrolase family 28-related protein n=1 Tax=unclassified Saccharibacter TaxID=2648722 RepID=UPI00132AC65F|nr:MULTISPECIES: glycosyl hydrolase family 28-related protein [unclassified Saccharibacter]MXV35614.1 hypothetical protein [Saccharibacter sp. EH611]MXV65774.1 hypothetical protein [Saccharibacter sp. EH60]